eukprot:bmy_16016T0
MGKKHSENMFLFIGLGIFLLFSLKGSPQPNPTVGVFADLSWETGFNGWMEYQP